MSEISTQVQTALSGLTREFDLIANNLANVSTPGFKRQYNDFSKSLIEQQGILQKQSDKQLNARTVVDFSQGSFNQTGRSLDLALCGKGFFVIETPNGPLYTRNGSFRLNENSQIVDLAGRIVGGQSGAITIPQDVDISLISVGNDGTVSAGGVSLGQLQLVDFQDDQTKLIPAGMNCFKAPENVEPQTAQNLIVKQGFQEGSNVQMMEELVDMIMVTRLYEANVKSITKSGETTKQLLDVAMSG